jgi:hypothetical protein
LKKRTKKLLYWPSPRGAPWITGARHHWQKFLLLFSKKKRFLPALLPGASMRSMMVWRSVCAAVALGAPQMASASWMHCVATGTDATGAVGYYTTVANVGALTPARLAHFKQLLAAYVAKADPEARGTAVTCYTFDDQLAAQPHYSTTLSAAALKLGWDHVVVVNPESWLAEGDIVDDPSRP